MRISDWSSDVCSSDLGHGGCGGVKASLSEAFKDAKPGEGGFIAHWIDLLDEERDRVRAAAALHPDLDAQRALEQAAVRVSIRNLRTFPCIPEREAERSEEHTSELQSLMRISYAVFCLKKNKTIHNNHIIKTTHSRDTYRSDLLLLS